MTSSGATLLFIIHYHCHRYHYLIALFEKTNKNKNKTSSRLKPIESLSTRVARCASMMSLLVARVRIPRAFGATSEHMWRHDKKCPSRWSRRDAKLSRPDSARYQRSRCKSNESRDSLCLCRQVQYEASHMNRPRSRRSSLRAASVSNARS